MNHYYESEERELKTKFTDAIVKEIVSFLNARGGIIYIGVADDGTAVGVSNVDETLRKIGDIVSNQIEPIPSDLIRTSVLFEDNKSIVEITIAKGFHSLYCIKKYGYSQLGCPIRIGTSCHEMTTDEISIRYQKRFESNKDYMTVRKARYGEITTDSIQLLLTNHGYHINPLSFEQNYDLRNNEGDYNQLAELISDKNSVSFIFVKFRGKDKASVSERTDYGRCSIISAYYNMKNRLVSENICMTDTTTRPRVDKYLYDIDAVNEAVINAIVHNDWSITEPIVCMFEDRLEILSHGGLPAGQTKEQFIKGISVPRNSALMRIFQDLEITEHTEHGIPKILSSYGENAFEVTDNYINVVIPFDSDVAKNHGNINGNINGDICDEERVVIELLINNPQITQDTLAELSGQSKRTISRIVKSLKERDIIIREGSNKSGKWIVKR